MPSSPPQPFDTEKAKQAWIKIFKGILFLLVLGASGYYVFTKILTPADTPLQTAVKAADVEGVRRELGPANSPDAVDRADSAYRLALEGLSPSKPETTEILKLVLAPLAQRRDAGGPANATFSSRRTRSQGGSGVRFSAVELAARQWSPDGVRLLIEHGLTIRSEAVHNALVTAASNGAAPIITLLLDAGADVNGRDGHHDTALAMARRVNNDEIVKLLLTRGARE